MTRINLCLALFTLMTVGCSNTDTSPICSGFGCGPEPQPGAGLVYGGQATLTLIHSPEGDVAQLSAWGRDFTTEPLVADSLPIPFMAPMACTDISTSTFPRTPTAGSEFLDLGPAVTITADDGQVITAARKMDIVDDQQYGIPLGYQNQPFAPTMIQHGQYYTLAFTGSETLTPSTFFMASPFQIFDPAIGVAPVAFTHGQGLDISWDPIGQTTGPVQVPERTFSYVVILGPVSTAGQVKWRCPMNDGLVHDHFTIPAEVVDQLPPTGTLVLAQETHVKAKWNERRFDLITSELSRSPFSFAP